MENSQHSTNSTIKKRIERKQKAWLEAFKNQWTIAGACRRIGIDRKTYYNWAKKYPDFLKEKEEIEVEQIEYVESKLVEAINEKNIAAIIFYLKCRSKKWRPTEKRIEESQVKSKELEDIAATLKKLAERNYDKRSTKVSGTRRVSGSKDNMQDIIQKLKRAAI